ncbi:unnamed protein product [Amaranthus hypochondriacus]
MESKSHKIWGSDVIVKNPKNVFLGKRKWNSYDIGNLILLIVFHGLALFAPFTFNWKVFLVSAILTFITGVCGVTLSYHRNLSHRSFRLPKLLEYFFAYCGLLAFQGDPIGWVSIHRYHHQFTDLDQDPHSPIKGFWFSHFTWLIDTEPTAKRPPGNFGVNKPPSLKNSKPQQGISIFGISFGHPEYGNVKDMQNQPFYMFLRNTYILHILAFGLLLYTLGGFPYFVWGMGVRFVYLTHVTGLLSSACHVWGNQIWNTDDLSKNNWWVGVVAAGEGWHNNHHAFPYSARHGLEWWQIDVTWYIVKLLQVLGLATDIKLPIETHKQRLTFKTQKM